MVVIPERSASGRPFRPRGFDGTSIKALERATGPSSGLHNTFGDKSAIFHLVLGRYVDTVVAKRLAEHLAHQDPLEGLRALFLTLLDEPGGGSFGCLLTSTAVEFGPAKSRALADLRRGFRAHEDAFLAAIERLFPGRSDPAIRKRRCAR